MTFCPKFTRHLARLAVKAVVAIGFFSGHTSLAEAPSCFEQVHIPPGKLIAKYYEQLQKNEITLRTRNATLTPVDLNVTDLISRFKNRKEGELYFIRIDEIDETPEIQNVVFSDGHLYGEVNELRAAEESSKFYSAKVGTKWVTTRVNAPLMRFLREVAESSTDLYYVFMKRSPNGDHTDVDSKREITLESTPPGQEPLVLGKLTFSLSRDRSTLQGLVMHTPPGLRGNRLSYLLYSEAIKWANHPKRITQKLAENDLSTTLIDLMKRVRHMPEYVEPDPLLTSREQWAACCSSIQKNYDLNVVLMGAVQVSTAIRSAEAVGYKLKEVSLTTNTEGVISIKVISERRK